MQNPKVIERRVFEDNRGWFSESHNRDRLREEFGIVNDWMQDNHSYSLRGVIRGIHYQLNDLAKLVRCIDGRIMDVIVDLRKDSSGFGKFLTFDLSRLNGRTLYVPPGFGHSFLALEDSEVLYKVDKPWDKKHERGILYDDPELDIPWRYYNDCPMNPIKEFIVSSKDRELPRFRYADVNFES